VLPLKVPLLALSLEMKIPIALERILPVVGMS
jgi:hypothetical protein